MSEWYWRKSDVDGKRVYFRDGRQVHAKIRKIPDGGGETFAGSICHGEGEWVQVWTDKSLRMCKIRTAEFQNQAALSDTEEE